MSKDWFKIIAKEDSKEATIRLYGYIYPWDVSAKSLAQELDKLTGKFDLIKIRINSGGGDVLEGLAIYNAILNCPIPIEGYVDGLAGSMAGVIAMACPKLFIAKNARIMVHCPSGGAWGSSAKLRETAELMDSLEADLVEAYVAKTGLDEAEVKAWFQPNKDTWFTAKQAVDNKIADDICEPVIKKPVPKNLSAQGLTGARAFYENAIDIDFEEVVNVATATTTQTSTPTITDNKSEMDKNLLITALGLTGVTAQSTDAEFNTAIQNVVKAKDDKIAELETKLAEQETAAKVEKATALVDAAVAANKVPAAEKEQWVKDATENFDLAKRALDKIVAPKSVTSQIKKETSEGEGEENENKVSGSAASRIRQIQVKNATK